jgi:hypothetical protein
MFGRQRDQSGVLIELDSAHEPHENASEAEIVGLRNLIW